jgi:septum formation protein
MYQSIYLASQSPRRAELLTQLGVRFELLLAQAGEDAEALETQLPNEASIDYVARVTLAKLEAARLRLSKLNKPWAPILSADTTVAINSDRGELILGKPSDHEHALEILNELNGKTHTVHTAVAILSSANSSPLIKISSSEVEFGKWSTEHLKAYIGTNEPMGKAGAYGIQGIGGSLIAKFNGSYSGIMGLPLFETSLLLDQIGIKFALNKQ